ncbi:sugar ABC transporter permease [Pleomorphomonas diazotrophica]|uniref:Maltose/maltodextrin transport system permease protein MalG n=1 Tax=Pleomorphomonas diazotrophica TaxID=1166257 RepID=A0A1I4RPU0_9HYPH|nr:carbohydrate ABC transporter permease [Pleomorphomonas diazotrophica]PKR88132.1 sugar ABC transporter permease [Pleomorphomonas diazotrophica]SFM54228.1 multiple sugar transport system permease protein [Pleomorphomonas diazotrophica]
MRKPFVDTLRWLAFIAAVAILNFPVIATLVTSLKSEAEIMTNASLMIEAPTLGNYAAVFAMADRFDILHFLTNSLVASLIGSVLAIALAFPAAYAMARFGVGRTWLLPLAVNLRAVPLIIFAIPIYLMYQQVGLLDTRFGLALILCLVNVPLVLVLFASSIADLPLEIEEAGRVDGAGTLRLLVYVVAPMSLNVVAASTVLAFIYSWNEFLFGLMLTTNSATPVSVGASFFFAASGGGVRWGVAAAVMILATLPPLVLGLLMYRQIGRSMTAGAVKG